MRYSIERLLQATKVLHIHLTYFRPIDVICSSIRDTKKVNSEVKSL